MKKDMLLLFVLLLIMAEFSSDHLFFSFQKIYIIPWDI